MRTALLCLLGSVTFAPFSCGLSERTPETSSSNDPHTGGEVTKGPSANNPKATTGTRPISTDPLVPPIALRADARGVSPDRLTATDFAIFDFSSDNRAQFHAHGEQVCASGCAASRHPTRQLSKAKYLWLLRRFAEQPLSENSPAVESLMYYGRQTLLWMQKLGTKPLDEQRVAFLKRELSRTHALISFRIVDEDGITRVYMPPTRVPLDRRHEFRMETTDLPPLITSGTVKRVGLHHLWTRL